MGVGARAAAGVVPGRATLGRVDDERGTAPDDETPATPDGHRAPADAASPVADERPLLGGGRFGLFSESLVVGLGVSLLSLPVVTALPAMAAGVAHLRRHLEGRSDTVADLWAEFRAACRGVWVVSVASVLLLFVLLFNLQVAGTGALPGGTGVRVFSAVMAVTLLVVLLRAAAGWTAGASWKDVLRDAGRRTGDDLTGSFLLVVALGLCAVIVWMLAPLAVLVPGLLSLAVVAVERRATAR